MSGRRFTMAILTLAALSACGAPASLTDPGRNAYETTLELQAPLLNPDGIDRVVYRWTTNSSSGPVSMNDVVSLVVELYAGAAGLYADTVRAGGAYQPMGGSARWGLTWDFDLDRGVLTQMNNVLIEQQRQAWGRQYSVEDNLALQDDSIVGVRRTMNGVVVYQASERLANQATVVVR